MEGRSWNARLRALDARFLTFAFLLAGALLLRYCRVDQRPMHNDEAVNGIKFNQLWQQHQYRYDPNEHHGPTLYYATLPIVWLGQARDFAHLTEGQLRLVTVLFGVGVIGLLPLLADGLGRKAVIWAAVFSAISPAMVFYSDYYIHEMLLIFFTLLALTTGWRYWRSRRPGWIIVTGGALGLMHATKETCVISFAAAALALGLNQFWNRYLDASGPPIKAPRLKISHLAAGLGAWLLVAVLLFSSFFTNASGPFDSIRTYLPWLARAGGDSVHVQPWNFYFSRLLFFHADKGPIWSEALVVLLAVVGGAAAFIRKGSADASPSLVRFVAIYTLGVAAAYTLISYKTPWCLLNFWLGALLLAGVGAVVLVHTAKHQLARFAAALLVLAGAGQLAAQAWQATGLYASDWRNPYVYAQTSADVLALIDKIRQVSQATPQGRQMMIKVVSPEGDFWPWPWYLREFKNVGFWETVPADPYAPVMIVSSKLQAALDEKKTHLMVGYFQFRPAVFFELYVELELWRAYLAAQQK